MVQAHQTVSSASELRKSLRENLSKRTDPNEGFGIFSELRRGLDQEVRLSWLVNSYLGRAKDAHNYLLIGKSELYSDQYYMKLLAASDRALEAVVYHGAPTEGFRETIPAIAREWAKPSDATEETILRGNEHLITLARVADLLDERDPRELAFVRQMERFVELIVTKKLVPEATFYPVSSLLADAGFFGHEDKLFRSVIADREKYFREFDRKRLNDYCGTLRDLGLRVGLSRKVVHELEDTLFIELEWFHS